jgi:hypothetical protein
MSDPIEDLEHRIDTIERWQAAKDAVEKSKAETQLQKHTSLQIFLSVISSLTMLVNLWLTLTHHK